MLIEVVSFLKREGGRAQFRNNCKIQLRMNTERGREGQKQREGKKSRSEITVVEAESLVKYLG